ncbi:MAG TPA: hypothetical protein DCY86_13860 [Bdellovibrionales bacterium]|nr:hypothetical protein [Bdellovibrionales bacterium]
MFLYIIVCTLLALSFANFAGGAEVTKENACFDFKLESYFARANQIPQLKELEYQVEIFKHAREKASQRPNPELSFQYIQGDQFGEKVISTQTQIVHTMELGGKRAARVEAAESELKLTELQSRVQKSHLISESFIIFHKLRQIGRKKTLLAETLRSFEQIAARFKARGTRGPEEEVALSTIEMVIGGYQAQSNDLLNEENQLATQLRFLLDLDCLPLAAKDSYQPIKIQDTLLDELGASTPWPKLELASLELQSANAKYVLEKSNSWPDLEIGPILQSEFESKDQFYSVGFTVTLPLPLLNVNAGGRAEAFEQVRLKEWQRQNTERLQKIEAASSSERLKSSLKIMQKLASPAEIDRQHQRAESLMARGVLSTSMSIEVHRQLIDFTDSYFETEIDILESMAEVIALYGKLEQLQQYLK